jgi:hypothetical protein
MSEYHIVPASGEGTALASFDAWGAARERWLDIRDKLSVRLLCMWPCGCVRQAIRKGKKGNGWRRVEACPWHVRPAEERSELGRKCAPEYWAFLACWPNGAEDLVGDQPRNTSAVFSKKADWTDVGPDSARLRHGR